MRPARGSGKPAKVSERPVRGCKRTVSLECQPEGGQLVGMEGSTGVVGEVKKETLCYVKKNYIKQFISI